MAPRRVFPEDKVAELNSMLSAVVKAGTGRRADLGFAPQGGKTGTNQGYRDAWYVGFTGHHITGVWFGNDDFTADERSDRRLAAGADLEAHHARGGARSAAGRPCGHSL